MSLKHLQLHGRSNTSDLKWQMQENSLAQEKLHGRRNTSSVPLQVSAKFILCYHKWQATDNEFSLKLQACAKWRLQQIQWLARENTFILKLHVCTTLNRIYLGTNKNWMQTDLWFCLYIKSKFRYITNEIRVVIVWL